MLNYKARFLAMILTAIPALIGSFIALFNNNSINNFSIFIIPIISIPYIVYFELKYKEYRWNYQKIAIEHLVIDLTNNGITDVTEDNIEFFLSMEYIKEAFSQKNMCEASYEK